MAQLKLKNNVRTRSVGRAKASREGTFIVTPVGADGAD